MEKQPFHIKVGDTIYPVGEHDICLEMFRPDLEPDHSDRDYIAVLLREGEGEEPREYFVFDRIELLTWMGGIALSRERERMLRNAERSGGSFREHMGWNPDVYIKDYMIPEEEEVYTEYLLQDLDDDHIARFIHNQD